MRRITLLVAAGCLVGLLSTSPAWSQAYVGETPPNAGPVDVGAPGTGAPLTGGQLTGGQRIGGQRIGALSTVNQVRSLPLGGTSVAGGQVVVVSLPAEQGVQRATITFLAFTGTDIAALVSIALASVLAGAVLVRRTRRTRATAPPEPTI